MPSKAGIGYCDQPSSFQAGAEVAQRALQSGAIDHPTFGLLFCTGRHDPARLMEGVRSVLGAGPPIIGGYGVGVITRDAAGYDGHQVGLALVQTDDVTPSIFCHSGLPGSEAAVGEKLGADLAATGVGSSDSLLLFYDTVHQTSAGPRLNMATPLLEGVSRRVSAWPSTAGMGVLGDMQLQPTWQFAGDRAVQQSAVGLLLKGRVRMDTTIMHGCRPMGRYHRITKAEGPMVLEIDGRPALAMIQEMLGPASGLTPEDYVFFVTLGVNKGDKFGEFREDDYANRLCIAVDQARQGLVMFENDLCDGMEVQLMRRSMDFAYIGPRTSGLFERVAASGRRPILAFYIDCAGRAGAYCGMDAEEADEVRKSVPADVPLLGVYSGVEIAMLAGRPQALDWTGVLCVLSE